MKKYLLVAITLWGLATAMLAIPAKRRHVVHTQPDGTTVTLQLCGDEYSHFHATTDGMPVVRSENGTWCYASFREGCLVATDRIARNPEERSDDETAYVNLHRPSVTEGLASWRSERLIQSNERRTLRARDVRNAPAMQRTNYLGQKKGLVVLVQFPDCKFTEKGSRDEFDHMMNQEGYSSDRHIGSVHDYFYDQSYGQFDLTFDVVGPVTAKYNVAYYGQNNSYGNDSRVGALLVEALTAIKDEVDFSSYDWDGDGEVDQVYMIYAGHGEHSGAPSYTIWPHEFWLQHSDYGQRFKVGTGLYVDTYACGSELNLYGDPTTLNGIGVCCHEFSHCLGLPDFYDTANHTNFGMSDWDLMANGAYNEDARIPAPYTAYERWVSGWLEPVEIDKPTVVKNMKPITSDPEAYILYNSGNANEYYLLQNVQRESWGSGYSGHGLLVIHVDYNKSIWDKNTVNNQASHQRMTPIPADNSLTSYSLQGDPFPGTSKKTELTDDSTPAAQLFNMNREGNYRMGKPITDITESSMGLIGFSVLGGAVAGTPVLLEPENVTETGFTARWEEAENVETYTLQWRELIGADPSQNRLLEEDFSGFTSQQDGAFDISSMMDNYTQEQGWSGSKIYESNGRIKLGSSSKNGVVTTPLLTASADGQVTVRIRQEVYGSTSQAEGTVTLLNAQGENLGAQTITFTGDTYVLNFSGITQDFKVSVTASARIYITGMEVYGGYFDGTSFDGGESQWVDATTVADISGTSYEVTGLSGKRYAYRVKGENELGSSDWSEQAVVSLLTAIRTVTGDLKGFRTDQTVEVFTLDGRCVARVLPSEMFAQPEKRTILPAGVYVLRQGNLSCKVSVN